MLIAKTQIHFPQLLIIVPCTHGDQFAIHRLGIGHFTVNASAQTLPYLVIVLLAPQLHAALAVDSSGHTVRSDDDDMVRRHDRHHIAGTVQVDVLTVVPLPIQRTVAPIERAQIGIPCAEDDISAIHDGCCLTIVVDAVITPQQAVSLHVPSLESLVATLIKDAAGNNTVGDIRTVDQILPRQFAGFLIEPNEPFVAGGQNDKFTAHCRTREEHGIGLELPAQSARLFVHRLAVAQRIAVVQIFVIHPHSGEDRGIVGNNAAHVKTSRHLITLLWALGRVELLIDAISEHDLRSLANHLIIDINPLAVQINGHQRVAIIAATHIQGPHHHSVDAIGLIEAPGVVMAALMGDNGVFLEDVHISAVIVQVVEYRIMVDAQHLHARLYHCRKGAVKPQEVFLLDVTVAHLHERAAVHAHDHQVIDREDKTVVAPQVVEGFAGTLAPVVLVIARNDIQGMRNAVEDTLDVA